MEQEKRKTAFVTGAARRIGRAIARELAFRGWDIVLHFHRSRAEAEALAMEIQAMGRKTCLLSADLSQEMQVTGLIAAAVGQMGTIGLLVNNASVFYMDRAKDHSRASWDDHLETNLRAPLVLAQHFAAQAKPGASIINLLDQRVLKPTPYFFSYSIAKAALWHATRMLALALAPDIRVNAIGPGPTLPSPKQSAEQFAEHCRAMPLGRGATPQEIAATVCFLVDTPSITGQIITLDGGEHLGWQVPRKGYMPRE